MAKKGDSTHSEILERMKPFPPSPVRSVYLPVPPSRKVALMIFGGIGGLMLVALIGVVVLWQAGYRIEIPKFTNFLENSDTPVEPSTPKQSSEGKVDDDGHRLGITEQVTEEPVTAEASPPISKLPSDLLMGRYPVLKYTTISETVRPEDSVTLFVKRYENRIFPKKYRNERTLAEYNNLQPPYSLTNGTKFRIPTVEHIALPKTGYETEIQEIQSKLELDSNNIELINRLGIIYFKRNELHEAASTFQKGVALAPDSGVLRNNLGYAHLLLEDEGTEGEFQQAIAQIQNPAVPLCNLGTLYMTTQKWDLAVKAFQDALEQDANLLDAKYNLALTYKEIGQIDLAKTHLNELAQLLPDDAQVQSILDDLVAE